MSFVLAFLALAGFACGLAFVWAGLARRYRVLDWPGQRSSHTQPTPRGGGVAIVLAMLVGLGGLLPAGGPKTSVILALVAVAVVGFWDDLRPLPAWHKLIGQGLAALPLALACPWPEPLSPASLPLPLAHLLSWAFVVFVVNAWNFMDGINGIAALAASGVAACVLVAAGSPASVHGTLAAVVMAATLGFLPMNFPKARVFMGDCGSHALGMAVAALVLWPVADARPSPAVAMAAASPFLLDVLGTLARRAWDGERLTEAHRRHLYQLVTRKGYSHARVTLGYTVWVLASGLGAMTLVAWWGGALWGLGPVLLLNAVVWWRMSRFFETGLRSEGGG